MNKNPITVDEVFPSGGRMRNYQERPRYETQTKDQLNKDGALVLTGRSGNGKSCIAVRVIEQNKWKSVRIECLKKCPSLIY